jgi:hypothetical protein
VKPKLLNGRMRDHSQVSKQHHSSLDSLHDSTALSVAQPVIIGVTAARAVRSGLGGRVAASVESGGRRGAECVPIALVHARAASWTHGGPVDFAAAVVR